MINPAKWLCGMLVVAATTVIVDAAMAGFAEPDESRIGILVWAVLASAGLHMGLLGGLVGWSFLGNRVLQWVVGFLMLPASLLSVVILFIAMKRANWTGAVASFSIFCIYATVWVRLLGSTDSSARKG